LQAKEGTLALGSFGLKYCRYRRERSSRRCRCAAKLIKDSEERWSRN